MSHSMTVQANLAAGISFTVDTGSGHRLLLDASADFGGHGAGPQPMEMLLVGLAGCAGMDIVAILRKSHQQVTAYELRIHAERAEKHPKIFTRITVEHILTGHALQPAAVQRAIDLNEERYCGVSAMLGESAMIVNTFQLHEV